MVCFDVATLSMVPIILQDGQQQNPESTSTKVEYLVHECLTVRDDISMNITVSSNVVSSLQAA